jgi:hypothetical protein
MANWSFLSNYGKALVCIAHDPGVRLREIAAMLGVTERAAYGIVSELAAAGYVSKIRDGRRNRYDIQEHLPIEEAVGRDLTIGEVLELLVDRKASSKTAEVPGAARSAKPARKATSR